MKKPAAATNNNNINSVSFKFLCETLDVNSYNKWLAAQHSHTFLSMEISHRELSLKKKFICEHRSLFSQYQ